MKKYYTVFSLCLLLLSVMPAMTQNTLLPGKYTGSDAAVVWQGADVVWQKQFHALPTFISFREGAEPDVSTFFTYLRKKFLVPSDVTFQVIKTESDEWNWRHVRYQMYVRGVPVFNGIFILHLFHDKVRKYNGYIFSDISVGTTPSLSEPDALKAALAGVGAQQYKWELPQEEKFIKNEWKDEAATFYPKGTLLILQIGDNTSTTFKLVWQFDIYAHDPMGRWYVYVDAQNGEVVKKTSRICTANTGGTAATAYRGTRAIVADSYNGAYRLRETTRGQGIRTYNMQKGTSYGNAVDFTDADNYWNNVNSSKDQYATDAHWGAEMTYDFYQTMGRNSVDNNGYPLNLYVHYSTNYVNAFWDGTRMTFGDGNSSYTPLTSLDVTGHEISHGLDEHTANLDYQGEPGALNESFSDIFGTCTEWFADSSQGNWLMAEDLGTPFRSMSNPKDYGDPNTYNGTYWYTGTGDYGGVHTNSGVQNQWFYRLCVGGSGTNDLGNTYSVSGIGMRKAQQIAWRNMVHYLTNTSDYADARFYAIQAANDIFGACSPEAISTTKAWYSVGVGADFSGGADAQFSTSNASGCTVPFTVNFNNGSSNASTFYWDFGDSIVSTLLNPSHTYTQYGDYTVRLIAQGGACGVDSIVSVNAVSIQPGNPCVVMLPKTGIYPTQTSCTGIVYDDGGPGANYSSNTNSSVTIAPVGAASVTLTFTQFGTENTYDFIYVYDGPNTASPLLGSYTGNNLPASVTSSGSSVTIRQYSDMYVEDVGFAIHWQCNQPNSAPAADFASDVVQTCSGEVQFSDRSTGGVYGWLWNFGDGSTSTQQNPTHTYLGNGTYTVSLTATNGFGSNTKTRISFITVNRPSGPAVSPQVACGASSFTLQAAAGDSVRWYDSAGNQIFSGNPFITPVVATSTIYYAEEKIAQPTFHAGAADNSIGTGAIFTNADRSLVFTVYKKSVLASVQVYAQGDGYRTIQYRNQADGVLFEKTVFIPDGPSRVVLNIPLIPGTGYRLGLRDTVGLYRNSTGAAYPYTDPNGIVRITDNDVSAQGYYYFFYDWEVREDDCISERTPVQLSINMPPSINGTTTNSSCYGADSGAIQTQVLGGASPYSYLWNDGQTDSSRSLLSSGVYGVTVQDKNNCSATASFTVQEPPLLTLRIDTLPDTCGRAVGSAIARATGGTGSYRYLWNTNDTSATQYQLGAGSYSVTLTDQNNCSVTADATIGNEGSFQINLTATNPLCFGSTDGTAAVSVAAGVAPYQYLWNTGATDGSLSQLGAGDYGVSVSDALGCSVADVVHLAEPTPLSLIFSTTEISCNQYADGSIVLTASGGTPGYIYSWANQLQGDTLRNLAAGVYGVTVTDAHQCSISDSVYLQEPDALHGTIASTDADAGQNNGTATLSNVGGGTAPYHYLWSTGDTTSQLEHLAPGSYVVTVSDEHGCSREDSASVGVKTGIASVESSSVRVFPNPSRGLITVAVSALPVKTYFLLRNVLGQLLFRQELSALQTTLDISSLPGGIYIAELEGSRRLQATVPLVLRR